jgi:DNA-binding CsgD family transcriptional regulator
MLQGHSNQKIGEALFISVNTVKTHIRNIYAKFDINSRYELVALMKNSEQD